jgi:hypothetical protein
VQAMHCKGIRCNTEAELPEKMAEFLNYNGNTNNAARSRSHLARARTDTQAHACICTLSRTTTPTTPRKRKFRTHTSPAPTPTSPTHSACAPSVQPACTHSVQPAANVVRTWWSGAARRGAVRCRGASAARSVRREARARVPDGRSRQGTSYKQCNVRHGHGRWPCDVRRVACWNASYAVVAPSAPGTPVRLAALS